ncbi:MAG TPA: NTP transferase domain-containing protein [Bacillota bacterium]|jgi:putative nucleotidyltransferase with HDIG domain|nr:NTP transferase domain-containing protein [Peptococcaceae bacterium MAG4]NLW36991.1 NTP transferase domain-containing protein [Peptococcaceae bacterium]HPZ43716.1 NTP transferase domain-containing protein [Bacillota bacterium]HUM58536.1 NTP transferase domain-containing protein [Bacillota bacterium]
MVEHERVAAIILAGGYSSRMGDFKPLLKLGPYCAIEHAVRCFLQAGVCDVRVVAGYRAEEVAEVARTLGVTVICNPNFDLGMYSSVQAGVKSLEDDVEAFFILPVDYPLVDPATIKKLLDCRRQVQHGIIYPVFNGKRGHPPLISTKYKDEIVSSACPGGLREILFRHEHDAFNLAVPDKAVLLDMDTPEDYQCLQSYLKRKSIPTLDECRQILREARVSEEVKEHCSMVAAIASKLAAWLNRAGAGLNEDLILAGALLHDIARSEPDHPRAGARLLVAMGYPSVAEVVGMHMDIEVDESHPISEAEVVFLADKMVEGKDIVSFKARFAAALQKYQNDLQACAAVTKRLIQAERIIDKIESITGHSIESILVTESLLKTEDCAWSTRPAVSLNCIFGKG